MTERADQRICINAPAHSTAHMQAFLAKRHITQVCQPPLQPRFGSLWLVAFPEAKIVVEREEIRECDGHTVHKLSQQRLTADWLALQESDCSRMRSKVPSALLPSYIKATRPVLEIFKMAGYFPDRPRILTLPIVGDNAWYTHCSGSWLHMSSGSVLYHLCNYSQKLMPLKSLSV